MEQEYKKKLKDEKDKMDKSFKQKLSEKEKDLENNFLQRYQKKESEMKEKYNKLTNEIKKNMENNNSILKSSINTVHNGIKCSHCFIEPIVGIRYKCSHCNEYNLCQECEEKNSETGKHPYDFIKIRKEEKNNNIAKKNKNEKDNINNNKEVYDDDDDDYQIFGNEKVNNDNNNNNDNKNKNNDNPKLQDYLYNPKFNNTSSNLIKDDYEEIRKKNDNNKNYLNNFNINENNGKEKDDDKEKYSYECVKLKKKTEISEGEKDLSIDITLKNNKNTVWLEGETKLVFSTASELQGEDINLEPQGYNEQKTYKINIKGIEEYPCGSYNCKISFEVDGEQYGDEINFQIIIKEKNKDLDKINNFRKTYNLKKEDFPDDKILNALTKHKNEAEAYLSLIDIH